MKSKNLAAVDDAISKIAVAISRLDPSVRDGALDIVRAAIAAAARARGDLDEATTARISENVAAACELRGDLAGCAAEGRA